MRSYLDIIIDLKDGLKPDYEEVRLACLMANDMLFFAEGNVKKLLDPKCSEFMKRFVQKEEDRRFYTRKISPEEWLGNHHPDNPEQKKFMEVGNKFVDSFLNK